MKVSLANLFRIAAVALALAFAGSLTASAQTTPPAANEKELLEYLKKCPAGQICEGRVSIPDTKSGTLVQNGRLCQESIEGPGNRWRGWVHRAVLVVLALFDLVRGRVRVDSGFSGQRVERFTGFERFVHWLTATSFIVLGLTGLNIRFGRSVLLPLLGEDSFASLSQLGKMVHNFTSFAFMAGIVLVLLVLIGHNLPAQGGRALVAVGVAPPGKG